MHITIDFPTKKLSGLKLSAFTLCSLIRFRQGKTGYGGRCRDSRGFLGEVMDISRRQVLNLLQEVIAAGYVEEAQDKSLCTTAKWEQLLEAGKQLGCEKISQEGVKKLPIGCEIISHNKEVINIHTQAPKDFQPDTLPDPYEMIRERLRFAPRQLKDKWQKKGLAGEALETLIDVFATKEVGKLKGDAWEVAQEVERLCNQPNYWVRLFTSAYAQNYSPQAPGQAKPAPTTYTRPKTNPNWQ